MTSKSLEDLKPNNLVNEIDAFGNYVILQNSENQKEIPEWQKKLVLKRMEENLTPLDAFEMLDEIEF